MDRDRSIAGPSSPGESGLVDRFQTQVVDWPAMARGRRVSSIILDRFGSGFRRRGNRLISLDPRPSPGSTRRGQRSERARLGACPLSTPGTVDRVKAPALGRWLHRYTLLLALSTWAEVITGALVTSRLTSASAELEKTHLGVRAAVGILAIGLGVWLSRAWPEGWVCRLGWIVLAGVIAEAALGNRNPTTGTLHALLAQLFFALTVAVSVVTSPGWTSRGAEVKDSSRASLRSLSAAAAVLTVLQVSRGAAVRHRAMGVATHIMARWW